MTTKERKIVCNKIQTPDGTILESRNVHDYVSYEDANGETYMVDGGSQYMRRNINTIPYKELSIYSDDTIEVIRENFSWGTYGKSGKEALKYVLLKEMSNAHIQAIIDTQNNYNAWKDVFQRELEYRKENSIVIKD